MNFLEVEEFVKHTIKQIKELDAQYEATDSISKKVSLLGQIRMLSQQLIKFIEQVKQ